MCGPGVEGRAGRAALAWSGAARPALPHPCVPGQRHTPGGRWGLPGPVLGACSSASGVGSVVRSAGAASSPRRPCSAGWRCCPLGPVSDPRLLLRRLHGSPGRGPARARSLRRPDFPFPAHSLSAPPARYQPGSAQHTAHGQRGRPAAEGVAPAAFGPAAPLGGGPLGAPLFPRFLLRLLRRF